jgi:glycosyltransferase involved in cell wall biosynthesis
VTVPSVLLVAKGLDIGGLERVVVDLARGLAARGAVVEVAVVNARRGQLRPLLDEAGVVVHEVGGDDRIGWRAGLRLARLIADPRFDIVHVHGPLPAVVARLRRRGAPLVVSSHTPWTALHPLTRWAWRLTAHRDAAEICVSASVAASLPGRIGRRTRVIPHGIDPAAIAAASTRRGLTRSAPDAPVRAITVARHDDVKNYPNLLRAVRVALDQGADLSLLIVGTGPRLREHRALAKALGLTEVVTFLEPRLDVLDVIASGDLLVVASDYEGQPLVVQEALALGLAVVGTAVGRIPELVSAKVGRVVMPRDPTALGMAIAELARDDALRAALAANARHEGHAWTMDDVIDAHLSLYGDVIDSTGS